MITPSRQYGAPDLEVVDSKPEFTDAILRAVVVNEMKIYVANINGGDSLDITDEYWEFYRIGTVPS